MDAYYSDGYRPAVQECYNGAYDYLTVEDKSNSYTPGSLLDIKAFNEIRNDFYYIDNVYPTTYSSTGVNSDHWFSSNDYTACVYNNYWKVFYGTNGYHYEIVESSKSKLLFIKIGLILTLVLLISLIVIKSSKPSYFNNLSLFGKHWKINNAEINLSYYFEHFFFTPFKVTKLIYGKATMGTFNITDKGKVIRISLNNGTSEIYKIVKHSGNTLILFDLSNSKELSFMSVGDINENNPVKLHEIKEQKENTSNVNE